MKHIYESPNPKTQPIATEYLHFLACAEVGSILGAADVLDIQQAGLSKSIRRLEANLGQTLFFRRSRGVELTEFGKALQSSLRQTMSFWDQAFLRDQQNAVGNAGELRVGAHPSVAATLYPLFFEKLLSSFPLLELKTVFETSIEITKMVANLELDIGFVVNPVKHADLVVKPLRQEFTSVWRSKDRPEPILLYNPEIFRGPHMLKKFSSMRQIQIKNYEVIANIVKNSNVLGLLPSSIGENFGLKQQGGKMFSVQLAAIWSKGRFDGSAKSQIVDLILKAVRANN